MVFIRYSITFPDGTMDCIFGARDGPVMTLLFDLLKDDAVVCAAQLSNNVTLATMVSTLVGKSFTVTIDGSANEIYVY